VLKQFVKIEGGSCPVDHSGSYPAK